ncbi:MAG: glycosyltransferase family 2 protein [Anaerolineales bacterium]|nr:glycosyltransferase family 2 protein [Anaerolineales bacterium]
MKTISVVSGCYNEEGNLRPLYERVCAALDSLGKAYAYELIFIDNASTDRSLEVLRELATADKRVKVIANTRNFGHVRSPYHALLQARGQAAIAMASDLQDPPELIPELVKKWEQGYKVVIAVKAGSQESRLMRYLRRLYYRALRRIAQVDLINDFTGFGLYDQQVIALLRELNDPYPYFRGLIAELGFARAQVPFVQPERKWGLTKNNFFTLYDTAMIGLTSYSRFPLRLATFIGMLTGTISFLVGLFYLVYKLVYWQEFSVGQAPLVVGLFFFGSVQLFFLGLLGEYIGAIYTQVLRRPLVVEKERINFEA